MFFMNCLCLIWALGECWGQCQCIHSQYFEEQSNSCNYRRHLKTHSAQWDIAGHLRTCLKKTQWKKQTNANSVISYLIRQEIWGDIWKHTVEKSQTNVTSVITHLHPLVHIIWGLIWEHRMEKLNRALCELGYSFSTVIVIVVEMFVILVKMSNNWKREAPPTLSYCCFTNWKEFPAKSAALVWVAFEIGKWWWWSAKTKIEKLWNDKGGENRGIAPTKWCDALIQHLKTNIAIICLFLSHIN